MQVFASSGAGYLTPALSTRPIEAPKSNKAGIRFQGPSETDQLELSPKTQAQKKKLFEAAENNNTDQLKDCLAEKINPNLVNDQNQTALHLFVDQKNIKAVKLLLEAKANPNKIAKDELTPLLLAVIHSEPKIVEELLLHGADVNHRIEGGGKAIHMAAMAGNWEVVSKLLDHYADLHSETNRGETPLHLAVKQYERLKEANVPFDSALLAQHLVIQNLLRAKADPLMPDKDRVSALDIAKSPEIRSLLSSAVKKFYSSAEWGSDEVVMDCFEHYKNINQFPQVLDSALVEESSEYLGNYIQSEIKFSKEPDKEKELKTKILQQFVYANNAKSEKQIAFWNNVAVTAFGKNVPKLVEDGNKGLDGVFGMDALVAKLRKEIVGRYDMIRNPDKYRLPDGTPCPANIRPPQGILFHGEPGTGKSFIARRLGHELGMNVEERKLGDIMNSYKSGGVENLQKIFKECAEKSKQTNKPTMLILDEFDRLAQSRENMGSNHASKGDEVAQLLQELEQAQKNGILVVGTCNHPETMDRAIRSKRIDKRYEVLPPNAKARTQLLQGFAQQYYRDLRSLPFSKLQQIARQTRGFSNADLELLTETAADDAGQNREYLNVKHFESAIPKVTPSYSKEKLSQYNID